jgi:hypothetical protein
MVNPGEVLLKTVTKDKPKMLSGLDQKGMWSGTVAQRSPVTDVEPPVERHDLTPGAIEKVNEVTPLSPRKGRRTAKNAHEAAEEG